LPRDHRIWSCAPLRILVSFPGRWGHFAPPLHGFSLFSLFLSRSLFSPARTPAVPPASRPALQRTYSLSPVGRLTNHFKDSRTLKDKTKLQHMVQSPDVYLSSSSISHPLVASCTARPARLPAPPTSKFNTEGEVAQFSFSPFVSRASLSSRLVMAMAGGGGEGRGRSGVRRDFFEPSDLC
jgi:hypothetical protein